MTNNLWYTFLRTKSLSPLYKITHLLLVLYLIVLSFIIIMDYGWISSDYWLDCWMTSYRPLRINLLFKQELFYLKKDLFQLVVSITLCKSPFSRVHQCIDMIQIIYLLSTVDSWHYLQYEPITLIIRSIHFCSI